MQDVIKKADVLIEALPYMQRFRGKIVVVKFGGSAMEVKAHHDGILTDIAFMACVGMRPVIVHGGGKAISRGMQAEGIEARFVRGLRLTCERTMTVVDRVMHSEINPGIVATLQRLGASAEGLRGQDVFTVARKRGQDAESGAEIDWGFVGEPTQVRVEPILAMVERGAIPVITPLGVGPDGLPHNINADTAAAAVAAALRAAKLVFLTDVPGLLRNPKDEASIMSTLHVRDMAPLIAQGVIDGGMLPKVEGGVDALRAGVGKIHMVDGRMPHSLLLEIFTSTGVGTEIIANEQK
ncbi:MAG: acetylglutamate kinase [Lentisphaerae bacterium]|nr:acetylglutamate kinase [Lentisphaerota bacterium]